MKRQCLVTNQYIDRTTPHLLNRSVGHCGGDQNGCPSPGTAVKVVTAFSDSSTAVTTVTDGRTVPGVRTVRAVQALPGSSTAVTTVIAAVPGSSTAVLAVITAVPGSSRAVRTRCSSASWLQASVPPLPRPLPPLHCPLHCSSVSCYHLWTALLPAPGQGAVVQVGHVKDRYNYISCC